MDDQGLNWRVNWSFAIYAERMMTVNTCDFLNPMRTAGSVRLAPHLQGTANTFAMAE